MAKTYRPYQPDQLLLLPPSLGDWLPEGHLAYFVNDLIDSVDLSAIESVYEREERGQPPYHPRMMTKVLVYGYCVGVFSSRRIERRLIEDIGFRVLAAGNTPDFRTISDFRKLHRVALEGLFDQVLQMAVESGALKLGRVALDGSKVKANASKHKAMSYGRMKHEQQRLGEEVRRMLDAADAIDEQEDALYGEDRRGDELPEELRRRDTRLKRIQQAKRALEERARRKATATGGDAHSVKPEDHEQYNFTDPESRIMKGPDGFVQAYNVQLAVDEATQLIVAHSVTQQANDKQQLQPMVEAIEEHLGERPLQVVADSGYCSEQNLEYLEGKRIDAYIATGKEPHGARRAGCRSGPLPKGATPVDRMKRKLQTIAGAKIYARRKATAEPVIGQIKQARGFRQFLLRGKENVRSEWALVCLTHNILKLYRICCS